MNRDEAKLQNLDFYTSLVLIFQVQALQNAADFPIFMNRDLNPAECNVLLDAYFYARMYVYVFTG